MLQASAKSVKDFLIGMNQSHDAGPICQSPSFPILKHSKRSYRINRQRFTGASYRSLIDDDLLLDPVAKVANPLGLSEDCIFVRDLHEGRVIFALSLLSVQIFLDDGAEFMARCFDEAVVLFEVRERYEYHAAETTFDFESTMKRLG